MADISYFEAWGMWLDGKSTLGNDLFGIPMIWMGRSGKIVAFAGGLTVILDLAGPDRLAAAAVRIKSAIQTLWGLLFGYLPMGILVLVAVLLNAWVDEPLLARVPDIPVVGAILELAGGALFVACVIAAMMGGTWLVLAVVSALAERAPQLFADPRTIFLRVAALLAVFVGFHFDLLAS
ncbi:hypothetical protein [Nonomuraea sp. NPDC050202]|uniref:hypothetical protein n=1 Tax=Nonomuraea sp. NPDC050202 TaxID=3155035 RepID=UPI0033CF0CAD